MTRRLDFRVLVAGGGVVGLAVALSLARAGAEVTLADPAGLAANASGVAAGMLAPAFETVLGGPRAHLALLLLARDDWPALAGSIGLDLDRAGAMGVGSEGDLDNWHAGLAEIGIAARRLTPLEAIARSPWIRPGLGGVMTMADWRLDASRALGALRSACGLAGVTSSNASVTGFSPGRAELEDGREVSADALVIATGASRSLVRTAPELARLEPVKGHILHVPGVKLAGPTVRLRGGYICPTAGGPLVGATMEPGRCDPEVDGEQVRALMKMAASVSSILADQTPVARTGVRAATPDGLPMVGRSVAAGVWLAVGARRNGWLLAPLLAEFLTAAMAGEHNETTALSFDPRRFGP
jgi:glycine oxidase